MLTTNKSINLNGTCAITQTVDGVETKYYVASFNANVSNNGLNYNIGINYTNKTLIDSTPENKSIFEADKAAFESEVQALLNQ